MQHSHSNTEHPDTLPRYLLHQEWYASSPPIPQQPLQLTRPDAAAMDKNTATPAPRKTSHAPQVPDWRTPSPQATIVQPPRPVSLSGFPSASPVQTPQTPGHKPDALPPTAPVDASTAPLSLIRNLPRCRESRRSKTCSPPRASNHRAAHPSSESAPPYSP